MATSWADTWIGATTGGLGRSRRASTVPLTETAPTSSSTDGIYLGDVGAIALIITAAGSDTITAGNLLAYIKPDNHATWLRCPRNDLSILDLAGLNTGVLTVPEMVYRCGRFMWAPSSVTLSGAETTLTIDYRCTNLQGGAF